MAIEIERKFLVTGDFKREAHAVYEIMQGYLSSIPQRVVRVRVKGDKGFITIKGESDDSGLARYEWEKEIPVSEAKELLKLCEPGIIEKKRHLVKAGSHIIEVDQFFGENEGLVMAEIELKDENEPFDKPAWLGQEVTGDARYYNAMLSKLPFTKWQNKQN